uniref:Uncharacterized protein n=1 Tax=Calidris pygmaea TaxID=425635 RepID=A0A8C3JMP4_9CHAR
FSPEFLPKFVSKQSLDHTKAYLRFMGQIYSFKELLSQRNSPACSSVSLGQEGLVKRDRKESTCPAMKTQKASWEKAPKAAKSTKAANHPTVKASFSAEKAPTKAAPEQQIVISVLVEGANLLDPWLS